MRPDGGADGAERDEDWGPGPTTGTRWVVPAARGEMAGVLVGRGDPQPLTRAEQARRVARADLVVTRGCTVAHDYRARTAVVHARGGCDVDGLDHVIRVDRTPQLVAAALVDDPGRVEAAVRLSGRRVPLLPPADLCLTYMDAARLVWSWCPVCLDVGAPSGGPEEAPVSG